MSQPTIGKGQWYGFMARETLGRATTGETGKQTKKDLHLSLDLKYLEKPLQKHAEFDVATPSFFKNIQTYFVFTSLRLLGVELGEVRRHRSP